MSALFPLGVVYNVAGRWPAGREFNGYRSVSSNFKSVAEADRRSRRFGDYNVVAKAILAIRHQVDIGRLSSIVAVN